MFNFFKRKAEPVGTTATFKITDMHCTSCALTIDDALEELPGVEKSQTNYARAQTHVIFDEHKTNVATLKQAIADLGYTATES